MDDCVRRAWLTLDDLVLPLEDEAAGYVCPELDLGYPEVRDVMTNRPDHHGVDDRTRYFGSRAISAQVIAATPDARIDEIASAFAPFMVVSQRPVLHYVLDREDNPERTITLRPAAYGWPIKGAHSREIALQWIAADPIAYGSEEEESTSWAGSAVGAGRIYSLQFSRSYPVGTTPPSSGVILTKGDVAVRPLLFIYGPIQGARVTLRDPQARRQDFALKASSTIDAGHWIEVDPDARTAYWDSDRSRSAMREINWWYPTVWPLVQPRVSYSFTLYADGGGANQVSQALARWRDGYLS